MYKISTQKKRITRLWVVAVCLSLFITLFFACDKTPANYEIKFGCGGGFVGKYKSYRVVQDGTVYYCVQAFTSPSYNEEGKIIGKIPQKDAAQFYSRLSAIEFNDINYDNSDDMSCLFSLKGTGAAHSVTWPMEFNQITPPEAIKPVIDIFKDIEKLVSPLSLKYEKGLKDR